MQRGIKARVASAGQNNHRSGHRTPNGGPSSPLTGRSSGVSRLNEDQLVFQKPKQSKAPALIITLIASIQPKLPKYYVLDTNVLMHDPTALFHFEENFVYLPIKTLEELDDHKVGVTEIARNARQTSRYFAQLLAKFVGDMEDGIPLDLLDDIKAPGRLFFQSKEFEDSLPVSLPSSKADNQILGVARGLRAEHPQHSVVLITKDINMRVKARVLSLSSEDYQSDKVLGDNDVLYSGISELTAGSWERLRTKVVESRKSGDRMCYRLSGPIADGLIVNQFVYDELAKPPFQAIVQERSDKNVVLRTLRNYERHPVWDIVPRNRGQNFALNLLMDPECDFVTLAGQAGTGKTLMTLAAGMHQIFEERRYSEIIVTRVTVPTGEDIGFLPGNEEEKMGPWMGALYDNLEVLGDKSSAGEWGRAATNDLIRSKIKIRSLNFMRGRTFLNKFLIIDEAQNLTPKQMKMLITRAGSGTKIVCLGNLAQIDTPYLTEGGSGLTYAVDRFKGWSHAGHVTLARVERSRLADYAVEVL